jgi:hypothetical protein
MALKRAAKANRRKAVVAEKRKLELPGDTLAERVRRAASASIRDCLVSETLFEAGIGTVVLARGVTASHVSLGIFLVDAWCLGVKDAYFRSADAGQLEMMLLSLDATTPMVSVDPSYARKLLRDAAAWAASIGISPHRDFDAVERLFGDVKADGSDATFLFGREGEPFYVPGPRESPALIRRRCEQLSAHLGSVNVGLVELDGAEFGFDEADIGLEPPA